LSLPNIVVVFISGLAIVYNYYTYSWIVFYHPYNLIMVAFAMTNMIVLGTVALFSQEKLINDIVFLYKKWFGKIDIEFIPKLYYGFQNYIIKTFTKYTVPIGLSIFLVAGSMLVYNLTDDFKVQTLEPIEIRNQELFFTGIHVPKLDSLTLNKKKINAFESIIEIPLNIISINLPFDTANAQLPIDHLKMYNAQGIVAMILWDPGNNSFSEDFLLKVANGDFDGYINDFAIQIRNLNFPVFLSFAPGGDDLYKNWGIRHDYSDKQNGEKYIKAYNYVFNIFRTAKATNVKWVWKPQTYYTIDEFYPGSTSVDYIGISVLNYGRASQTGSWHSFASLYEPFRHEIAKAKKYSMMRKPILITEFGAINNDGNQMAWMDEAFFNIMYYYPEIRGLVFYTSLKDKHSITAWKPNYELDYLDFHIKDTMEVQSALNKYLTQPPFKNTLINN
jgi:cellulose synthase (UDP-forming)